MASHYPFLSDRFIAFAHRGGSDYPPNVGKENSLHAFNQAVALGYRYIETDVQATRDGHLVCFHDPTLDRLTGVAGAVADYPLADLRQMKLGGTEPIPLFDEMVEALPGIKFNVDLKAPGAIEPLVAAIAAHGLADRILVDSFSQVRLSRFRVLTAGRIPTALGLPGAAWLTQVPGLSRLVNSPGVALQVPVTQQVGPVQLRVITASSVARAHAAGKVVHVWTIDQADEMERLIDLGVDGIFTDRPEILKDVLIRRGLWDLSGEEH